MPIVKTPVRPINVSYLCDFCKKGYMLKTKILSASDPIQIEHACSNCGCIVVFDTLYPNTIYEVVNTEK
jgi:hypothetical protein